MIELVVFFICVLVVSIIAEIVMKGNRDIMNMVENNKWERHIDEFYKGKSKWKQ